MGGIGATTLAVVLAPFQALFIAVSIPLLIVTPFIFATRVRKAELLLQTPRSRKLAPPPVQAGDGEATAEGSMPAGNR